MSVPHLSIVIATRNEAGNLRDCIEAVRRESDAEIVVCDGESDDGTPLLAEKLGARVIRSPRGLARQLNAGARETSGSAIFFLSADCRLVSGWRAAIARALESPSIVGGGFRLRFDTRPLSLRAVELGGNLRSRYLSATLADQGIFVRREAWELAGKFCESSPIPHLTLCRRLRRQGEIVVLPHPIVASARRYLTEGVWRTVGRHAVIYFRYRWDEAA